MPSASSPEETQSTCAWNLSSIICKTLQLSSASSATRIFFPLRFKFSLAFRSFSNKSLFLDSLSVVTIFCGKITSNLEPFPYSLSTDMVPFIWLTRPLTMLIPRPVPSMARLCCKSIRANSVNRASISSFRIPMPVSSTTNRIASSSSRVFTASTCKDTVPFSVYFTALLIRLIKIWETRISSPNNLAGTLSLTFNTNSKSFSATLYWISLETRFSKSDILYSMGTISIFPAWIFE